MKERFEFTEEAAKVFLRNEVSICFEDETYNTIKTEPQVGLI